MLKEEEEERVTNTTWRRKERKGNGNFAGAREQGERKKRKATVMLWGTMKLLMGSNIIEDVVIWVVIAGRRLYLE